MPDEGLRLYRKLTLLQIFTRMFGAIQKVRDSGTGEAEGISRKKWQKMTQVGEAAAKK